MIDPEFVLFCEPFMTGSRSWNGQEPRSGRSSGMKKSVGARGCAHFVAVCDCTALGFASCAFKGDGCYGLPDLRIGSSMLFEQGALIWWWVIAIIESLLVSCGFRFLLSIGYSHPGCSMQPQRARVVAASKPRREFYRAKRFDGFFTL
jgi:hypothetical protein